MNHKRKIIIDCDIEFPDNFTSEYMAGIIQDYIRLNRFVNNQTVQLSMYPINVRVVLNPITLASNMPDKKN